MSVVAAAIIGSSVVGGIAANKAAKKSAGAIREGTDAQVAESRRQYDQTREDFAPWREMGMQAMEMLQDPIANFYASPDYQFRKKEGMDQIGATFAARGSGGNALRALAEFNSNLASGEFGNWWGREFSKVESGRGANTSMVAANQGSSNNIVNAFGNQASNMANIYSNKYANINNAVQGGISNWLYAQDAGIGPWAKGGRWA